METLAVKYRPKCFQEVVGQDLIISILSAQIEEKRFKHVYLFAGPSGCGKTTLARIMADALNDGQGEPIEIDAASNNGVDSMRELIQDAQQMSLNSNYKVYIIDECHGLTTAAWNSILKLIEEPPMHTIFIFCTTNPEKVPLTIMTRVQRFDFKRISTKVIADRLAYVCNEETDVEFDYAALTRIAAQANGYMREALSLMDKCISYSNKLSLENVEHVLEVPSLELMIRYTAALNSKNFTEALNQISIFKLNNSNMLNVFDSIIQFFIDCAKYVKTGEVEFTNIPENYRHSCEFSNIDIIVERALKYRQLALDIDIDTLIDAFTLDICRRK